MGAQYGKMQVHQNHFQKKKTISSKSNFIKKQFHQKQFHQNPISSMWTLSSNTTFIKNHFHQNHFSSQIKLRVGTDPNTIGVAITIQSVFTETRFMPAFRGSTGLHVEHRRPSWQCPKARAFVFEIYECPRHVVTTGAVPRPMWCVRARETPTDWIIAAVSLLLRCAASSV